MVSPAVRVHVVEEGPPDAPALVLSGSLGSTLAMWDPQMPALSERFRVIRYDHRGHGASPVPKGPYGIDDLGSDLLAALDDRGVRRAHVCGASMGGQVAMWLAAHARERVDRLVLVCSCAWFGPPDPWLERAATVRAEGTGAVAAAVVERWFTPSFAGAHPEVVEGLRDMVAGTPPEGYAASAECVGTTDLRPDLAAIGAPTLVIAGAQDPAVTADRIDTLADGIRGSRVEVLDPAAHLASVERAERVTRSILDHLSRPFSEEET
jgi:3-oxoadipate enol-lactonase